jgi:hypothetical protein
VLLCVNERFRSTNGDQNVLGPQQLHELPLGDGSVANLPRARAEQEQQERRPAHPLLQQTLLLHRRLEPRIRGERQQEERPCAARTRRSPGVA